MGAKVELEFEHAGLKCYVVVAPMGHRCGYVGIPKKHPLYGVSYHDESKILRSNIIDKNLTPAEALRVHGGITFSDHISFFEADPELWYFGFDCAHCNDLQDPDLTDPSRPEMREYALRRVEQAKKYPNPWGMATVKDTKYVRMECENLADQLDKIKMY